MGSPWAKPHSPRYGDRHRQDLYCVSDHPPPLEIRRKKKILFLADRNILVDQTMQQDFKPFAKVMTKIEGKKLDSSYELYLSLYQQLAGDENEEPFRAFQPDFFDLIVIESVTVAAPRRIPVGAGFSNTSTVPRRSV